MLQKTQAIVLRATKYGDQKLIVDFYTEVHGRVTCMVRISTSQRGKMKKQLFQPLTVVGLELDYNVQKPLQKLCDIQLQQPWTSLNVDPVKMTVGLFLCEMLWHATRQEQGDKQLFDFVVNSFQWLDLTTTAASNFHLCFLLYLSDRLGFKPLLDTYEPQSYFDLRQGVFTQSVPLHKDYVKPDEAAFLLQLCRMRYSTMHLYRFTRDQRVRCLNLIIMYYRIHLPSLPELKSLEVLSEVFD